MKPSLKFDPQKSQILIDGSWQIYSLKSVEHKLLQILKQIQTQQTLEKVVTFNIANSTVLDDSGAWLLGRSLKALEQVGWKVAIKSKNSALLEFIYDKQKRKLQEPAHDEPLPWFIEFLNALGKKVVELAKTGHDLLAFFGRLVVTIIRGLILHRRWRWISIISHLETVGLKALPIVGLLSFLVGMVLAYQGVNQLSRFGAEIYTVDFLAIGILREIGVLLTAIIVAGRSGSAFTAQIGTMKLNQEIDALRTFHLNPLIILVIPRIIALIIALPLLAFFADLAGLLGGMVLTSIVIDLSPGQFMSLFQKAIYPSTFWVGMSKAPLFAILIGVVGCFRGLKVRSSAESVGKMTTQSVVEGIFLVILCDALMSILFSYLKI